MTNDNGFSLLEVAVALAILALSLTAAVGLFGDTARLTAQTGAAARAGILADSLLAEIGVAVPVEERRDQGASDDGFTWVRTISPLSPGQLTWSVSDGPEPFTVDALVSVEIEVQWSFAGQPRSHRLASIRRVKDD